MLLLWGGVLALRTARRIALFDLSGGKEACPLGLRQTGSGAAHHIQQPEAGVISGGDGAEPAAFFGAEHQHMVAFPLGTGHGQLCSHDAAGRLRSGKSQTDRVGVVPFPAELGPGALFDLGADLGVGIAHGAEVVDLLGTGDFLEPGFQQRTGGGIAAGQQTIMGFQRLHGGSGQTGIACTIYVRAKAAAEALSRLFQSRGRVRMDSQQRLCAPALPLGLSSIGAQTAPQRLPAVPAAHRTGAAHSGSPLPNPINPLFLIFTGRTPHPVRPALRRPTAGQR